MTPIISPAPFSLSLETLMLTSGMKASSSSMTRQKKSPPGSGSSSETAATYKYDSWPVE